MSNRVWAFAAGLLITASASPAADALLTSDGEDSYVIEGSSVVIEVARDCAVPFYWSGDPTATRDDRQVIAVKQGLAELLRVERWVATPDRAGAR